jgi:beta-ureidopropionase / N-carbamoyl-L-amino-acid hydrolase
MAVTVPVPEVDRFMGDLHALSGYRLDDAPGWSRPAFSPPYNRSRAWIASRMRDAGLTVRTDEVGNLIGTLAGTDPTLPAVSTGSHTDTVRGGGRFDGIVGVVGAIEAVRLLRTRGVPLLRSLRVVDFVGEEAGEFGLSCIGSRAVTGHLDDTFLQLTDERGRTLSACLEELGGAPPDLDAVRWRAGELHAFVELHIEQGAELEERAVDVGVVQAIAGISRMRATFDGKADHAGGTTMERRRDALTTAAETVLALEAYASDGGGVATTGQLVVEPGQANVVPGRVQMWAEMRSPDDPWLERGRASVGRVAEQAAQRRHVELRLDWLQTVSPVACDAAVQDLVESSAREGGYSSRRMASAAGHDAAHLASVAPMGMIFVPSRDGRSHCAEEWTAPEQIAAGIHVLAGTLARAAAEDPSGQGEN